MDLRKRGKMYKNPDKILEDGLPYMALAVPALFAVCGICAEIDKEMRDLTIQACTTHYGGKPKVDWACVREIEAKKERKSK
jgi:amino acid permease